MAVQRTNYVRVTTPVTTALSPVGLTKEARAVLVSRLLPSEIVLTALG
jgi:hypothetical protein